MEVTIAGHIDAATGLLVDLADFDRLAGDVVRPLNGRYLEADLPFFRTSPSTGENVVNYLWAELERRYGAALPSVRVWETRSGIFEIKRRRLYEHDRRTSGRTDNADGSNQGRGGNS